MTSKLPGTCGGNVRAEQVDKKTDRKEEVKQNVINTSMKKLKMSTVTS